MSANRFPPFKMGATYAETLGPAMTITDPAEARDYFERLVEPLMLYDKPRAEAETIVRGNLGYYAGYYDHATRLQVERVFACTHPVFGAATAGAPTAEEAFEAGKRMARGEPS